MGATTFGTFVVVKGGPREAFRKARELANEENGHQHGYSGDIQTVHGFKMLTNAPRFATKKFWAWEDDILMNDKYGIEKWETAGCVEVKGQHLKKWKEDYGLKGKRGIRGFYFFGWGAC